MLLELACGVFIGVFFTRLGLPTIFPLLIWFSVLGGNAWVWLVIGLASVGVVHALFSQEHSSREDVLVGFFIAFVGLLVYSQFFSNSSLDGFVFPILLLAVFFWFWASFPKSPLNGIGGIILLISGWWLLHERVVSAVLPAFFLGWWGVSWTRHSIYVRHSRVQKIRDACIGCFSGLLPGVGPGLVNVGWLSGRASLSMGVSNLVFSIGLASLNGSIRSAVAASLGDVTIIPWYFLLAVFGGCIVFTFIVWKHSNPLSFSFSPHGWVLFQVLGVFLVGGLSAAGVILASYSLRRVFQSFDLSLDAGMFILVPSILWFYGPY